ASANLRRPDRSARPGDGHRTSNLDLREPVRIQISGRLEAGIGPWIDRIHQGRPLAWAMAIESARRRRGLGLEGSGQGQITRSPSVDLKSPIYPPGRDS